MTTSRHLHFPSTGGGLARLTHAYAMRQGLPARTLLKHARLTLRELEDWRQGFDVRKQLEFVNRVAEALQDESLGFHLAQHADLREAGLYYYVLASARDLVDVLERSARYSTLANEGVKQTCVDGRNITVTFHHAGNHQHAARHQVEFWSTALVRVTRELTGVAIAPRSVRFSHERKKGVAELRRFFACDVEMNAPVDAIVFPSAVRHLPVRNADPFLSRLLIEYCEQALHRRSFEGEPLKAHLENTMAPLLPEGRVRLEDIARRLGMSRRTLTRRLAEQGLTFSSVLDGLRHELAKRYLRDRVPISQIAWLLGYQDVAAFSHAFKRWSGRSPSDAAAELV